MKVIELRAELQARNLDTKGDVCKPEKSKFLKQFSLRCRRESGAHRPS